MLCIEVGYPLYVHTARYDDISSMGFARADYVIPYQIRCSSLSSIPHRDNLYSSSLSTSGSIAYPFSGGSFFPFPVMIVRGASRCATKLRAPLSRSRPSFAQPPQRRRYAMPSSSPTSSGTGSQVGMLAPFMNELDRIAPSFDINGSQIKVFRTPTDFYETLKVRCRPPAFGPRPLLSYSAIHSVALPP